MGKYPSLTIDGKKKYVHQHKMEEYLNRPLQPNEHVYHIDGDHLNNNIENLIIIKKNITIPTKKHKKVVKSKK